MRKSIYSILLLFALVMTAYPQTAIKKSSVSPGGGSASNGNTSIVFSIGETAMHEQTQGNTHISEGFIGPDIKIALKVKDYSALTGIRVYPNPVMDDLYIDYSNRGAYEVHIFDVTGKEILAKPDNKSNIKLNLSSFPTGIYVVAIVDRKARKIKTYKIKKE